MPSYKLVAVKRDWVPEWLWSLCCGYVPVVSWKQLVMCRPFRLLLTREVEDA